MGPITDTHKLTFQLNMELAIQQKTSKLVPAFHYVNGLSGRLMQMVELFGQHTALLDLGRKADTPDIDTPVEPVWIAPRQAADGKLMELEDTIKAVMDPQSGFIKAMAAAMVRAKDTVLQGATFGPRKIGLDGGTTSSWSGDTVAVGIGSSDDSTATGMNVRKLLRGVRYMQSRQIETDDEEIFAKVNAQGMEELYRDITFVNTDYRKQSVLDEGKQVRQIMNIKIIPADGAAAEADYDGTTFTSAMWCKSGLGWGNFSAFRSDIPLRPDKMNRPHPQMEEWFGSSRTEDYKVVKILNKK